MENPSSEQTSIHSLIFYRNHNVGILNYIMILQYRVVYFESIKILTSVRQNLKALDHIARVVFSHDSHNEGTNSTAYTSTNRVGQNKSAESIA